jgi:hypothetical protein
MKHLKTFKSLLEEEEMLPMNTEPEMEVPVMEDPAMEGSEIYAEEWIKSSREDGDYDVTWTDEN